MAIRSYLRAAARRGNSLLISIPYDLKMIARFGCLDNIRNLDSAYYILENLHFSIFKTTTTTRRLVLNFMYCSVRVQTFVQPIWNDQHNHTLFHRLEHSYTWAVRVRDYSTTMGFRQITLEKHLYRIAVYLLTRRKRTERCTARRKISRIPSFLKPQLLVPEVVYCRKNNMQVVRADEGTSNEKQYMQLRKNENQYMQQAYPRRCVYV